MQSALLEIVIPCYNEGLSIKDLVERCNFVSSKSPINFILVDNGSLDNTWEQLELLTLDSNNIISLKVNQNIGYGNGILTGLARTKAPYVGWMHADLQTSPDDLIQIANWLLATKDVKYVFVKGKRKNRALVDMFFSFGMSVFESLLFRKKMTEINSQPTIFTRSLITDLNNAPLDFMLDLFAYNKAISNGYGQKRFFVYFGRRKYGVSSWNKNIFSRFKFVYRTVKYSLMLRIKKR
jgi:glycosyltransferase involved in cell wall biosynthesis